MVSGRYFFPNAPLLCLKRMPAWAVTSVNWIGPEGRGTVLEAIAGGADTGTIAGGGKLAAGCGEEVFCGLEASCLQPANTRRASSIRQPVTRIVGIGILKISGPPPVFPHSRAANPAKFRSAWPLVRR